MNLIRRSSGCIFVFRNKGMDCFKYWYNLDKRRYKIRVRSRFEILETINHIKRRV